MLLVLLVWLVVYYTLVPHDSRFIAGSLLALACGTAVSVALVAQRRLRSPDAFLAVGLLLIALGNASVGQALSFPSISDLFYLGGGASLAVGAARRYIVRREVRGDVLLEAAIVSAAGALLLWELVISRILEGLGLAPFPTLVAVAYPAVDLLLLAVAARIVIAARRRDGALWLVVAGCGCYLFSDIVVSTQLLGNGSAASFADLGWLAGYGLIAAGAIHPADRWGAVAERPDAGARPRVALLLPAAMLAPVFVLLGVVEGRLADLALVATAGILLSALVVVRLAMALHALSRTIAQRERLQVELEHQASHDSLTDLANRRAFTRLLEDAIAGDANVAVLFVDLDDFKAVNDGVGQEGGDRLLREAASRISSVLRPGDHAARLGGDEFAVLLHDVSDGTIAETIAGRVLDALRQPFPLPERMVLPRASIGIALSDGSSATDVIRNADIAMYLAKSQGKDRCQQFDVRLHEDVLIRLQVRSELEAAIEANQFEVHHQPIVDIASGRLVGTEALVRWRHPERGLVPPLEFIEIAESTGLIMPLGRWVLTEALQATRRWQVEFGRPDLNVSVNVSARQFEHAGFLSDVAAALAESGFAPARLTLEITESSLLDTTATIAILGQLKQLGVRISVDDFGTGYSSLSYVGRLPVDELKIDRAFIAALGGDRRESVLAASVIQLAGALDLTTIAEGIETSRQLELLRELGCDLAQGFFLARPMTPDAIDVLIRADMPLGVTPRRPRGLDTRRAVA